jgi:protein-S-isoprenylcysteine O-methyltransferase Ste14
MIKYLELKCPPPIVMLMSGIFAWIMAKREVSFIQQQLMEADGLFWPLLFFIAGILMAVAGIREFKNHQTTVNPLDPYKSSSLVTRGIYQFSRNPMYLGLMLMLLGWADFLDTFLAYGGALIFYFYISYFQIRPEEKILKETFGQEFSDYCMKVRRWL